MQHFSVGVAEQACSSWEHRSPTMARNRPHHLAAKRRRHRNDRSASSCSSSEAARRLSSRCWRALRCSAVSASQPKGGAADGAADRVELQNPAHRWSSRWSSRSGGAAEASPPEVPQSP